MRSAGNRRYFRPEKLRNRLNRGQLNTWPCFNWCHQLNFFWKFLKIFWKIFWKFLKIFWIFLFFFENFLKIFWKYFEIFLFFLKIFWIFLEIFFETFVKILWNFFLFFEKFNWNELTLQRLVASVTTPSGNAGGPQRATCVARRPQEPGLTRYTCRETLRPPPQSSQKVKFTRWSSLRPSQRHRLASSRYLAAQVRHFECFKNFNIQIRPPLTAYMKISKSSRNIKSNANGRLSTSIDGEFNSEQLQPTGLSF